jgi:hypothetical protein
MSPSKLNSYQPKLRDESHRADVTRLAKALLRLRGFACPAYTLESCWLEYSRTWGGEWLPMPALDEDLIAEIVIHLPTFTAQPTLTFLASEPTKTYTEAQVWEFCMGAHWWAWLCRERLGGPDKFPVPIPFPPGLDYEEKQDFCFTYWWEKVAKK